MLDFNHNSGGIAPTINHLVDMALEEENRLQTPRTYLGASRLGVACERALQFEYAHAPKDPGRNFDGQLLRIFAAGHLFEDMAIRWLRMAGFELFTTKGNRPNGEQFGFEAASGRIQGHVDGIIISGPPSVTMGYPCLWECKSLNNKSWKDTVKKGVVLSKPVYAAQMAIYQAYMEPQVSGISANPALFTSINKDTAELHHELVPFDAPLAQQMSDRAVRIIKATEAEDLLPRISRESTHFQCRMCSHQDRCWGLPS
ncbi:PD-(D/E)XK nuclease family protein [Magnetococcus sp. PR-3]|uniref:PD-(D/E)XK nuclease family protein n=1 Tax=Magnetococcus sp. PR-3 TaxID=3120355 RepID=UPI002FCE30CB